jgi:NADPH-dependent 2,4-dienoyl-CoA reductase/sulfur reductase-like enzyme
VKKYAIVGFGCAGYRAAEAIRAGDGRAEIHVFSETGEAPANPMLTTYYVRGAIGREGLFPFGPLEEIIENLGLIHRAEAVRRLDPAGRRLELDSGPVGPFDSILLATGAESLAPPVAGLDHPRVIQMRGSADADRLKAIMGDAPPESVLVVGASMTGIKIAELMHAAGLKCTLADLAGWIFPLAALEPVGRRIMGRLTEMGLTMGFGLALEHITPHGKTLTARFRGGREIEADLLALCLGARGRTALAREAGLAVGRGITVDRAMRSSAPGIYAAGDCCEAPEIQSGRPAVIGLWANAGLQGRVAGENMAAGGAGEAAPACCRPGVLQNLSHFFNMDFIGLGDVRRATGETLVFENDDYYLAAAGEGGRLNCLNLLGPPYGGGILKSRMVRAFSGLRDNPSEQLALLAQYGLPGDFLAWLDQA